MNSNAAEDSPSALTKPRKAAIAFIFVTVVLDVLSLGVTIPVAQKLIEGMVFRSTLRATDIGPSTDLQVLAEFTAEECSELIEQLRGHQGEPSETLEVGEASVSQEAAEFVRGISLSKVTSTASFYVGFFGAVWALMQFIFAPVMGALSDRFGRRRVILLSCVGLGLDYVILALAPDLLWFFVGRVLSGITASSFATAGAYIADVTPPEKRAASFGMIGAAWGIGFVLGPFVGGQLGEIGLRLPFWVAAFLTLLNAIYGFFILPESLSPSKRSSFSLARANPLGSLKLLRSHKQLLGLAIVLLIYQIAHQVFPSVFVLYAGYRYGWGPLTVGNTLMVVGLVGVLMQGVIVRQTAGMLGEKRMLFIALGFGAAGYFIYGIANTGWMFWSAIPVFAFVGFFNPAMQGLMTRRVAESEQGQLQGANSSLMGIAGVVGPLLFTAIFGASISEATPIHVPGAPFLFATFLHLSAMCLAWRVLAVKA